MGSFEDDAWFNTKFAEAECHEHGEMTWDEEEAEWFCLDCEDGDELTRTYTYG